MSETPRQSIYGWVIVAAAALVLTTAYALQFSYGVYLPLMAEEFGWSRADLSGPYSVYLIAYASLSLITGRITDTRGPRLIVMVSGLMMAAGFVLLSQASRLIDVYIALGLVAAIGMSGAFIPLTATVVKWFLHKRGPALGVTGAGVALAALLGPLATTALLTAFDWRAAMFWSALGAGAIMLTAAWLLKLPDAPSKLATPIAPATGSWTLRQAMKTLAYWQVLAIFSLTWSVLFMPYVHLPAYAMDLGFGTGFGAGLIAAMGIGGLVGRLVIGWALEFFGTVVTLLSILLVQVGAYYWITVCRGENCLLLSTTLLGLGTGSATILFTALLAELYGRAAIGAISGSIFAIAGLISGAGPYFGGVVRDLAASYDIAFLTAAAVNGAAVGVLLTLRRPPETPGSGRDSGMGKLR